MKKWIVSKVDPEDALSANEVAVCEDDRLRLYSAPEKVSQRCFNMARRLRACAAEYEAFARAYAAAHGLVIDETVELDPDLAAPGPLQPLRTL